MTFKGIDLNKIQKIKSKLEPMDCFVLDTSKLEKPETAQLLKELIAKQMKKQRQDTDMYIICEMAELYLKENVRKRNFESRLNNSIDAAMSINLDYSLMNPEEFRYITGMKDALRMYYESYQN